MPEFLQLHSVRDARNILWKSLPPVNLPSELIKTTESINRILSESIISNEDSPAFNRSSVDGFAVKSNDTFGASDSLPANLELVGEVVMGRNLDFTLGTGQAALIHTGGMLPQGSDAVVMLEQTQRIDSGHIEIQKSVAHNENILLQGEDVKTGDPVLSAGKKIRPEEVAALLALGVNKVKVYKKPHVSIFSSGDELIRPNLAPSHGQVRDINSYSLSSMALMNGGIPSIQPIIPDDPFLLEEAIKAVLSDSDLVIITAGSSASERDMTAEVIGKFGQPGVLVHGVNIKPGKPTILAVCDGKPMVGLPGNPVSALVAARLFVVPLIHYLCGLTDIVIEPIIRATLSINLASQAGRDDYFPVILSDSEKGWNAAPVFYKSNLIFSLTRANGLLHIPADVTGYSAGDLVEVILF